MTAKQYNDMTTNKIDKTFIQIAELIGVAEH